MIFQTSLTSLLKASQSTGEVTKDLEKRLADVISDIDRRLKNLENRVSKIPDPFVLYYKEPGKSDYVKINETLDDLHVRLNILETLTFES